MNGARGWLLGLSTGYADQPVRLLTCSLAECDGDATGNGEDSNPRVITTQDAVGGGYNYAQTFKLRDAPAPYDTGSPSTSIQTKNNAARGSKLAGWGS